MKHFAGLDVSVKDTSICIVGETGKICRETKFVSHPDDFAAAPRPNSRRSCRRISSSGPTAAARFPLRSSRSWAMLGFITNVLGKAWRTHEWRPVDLNGTRSALLCAGGRAVASVSFASDPSGRLRGIFIMRNPDKLAGLAEPGTALT